MSCADIREWIVSDDPSERAEFERHASGCPACTEMMEGHGEILDRALIWQRETPAPPDRLEGSISAALAREKLVGRAWTGALRAWILSGWRPAWVPLAALLSIAVISLALLWLGAPAGTPNDPELSSLLGEIDRAERSYVGAVARLEREAERVLEKAVDPETPSEQAALLLAYKSRLSHLEGVIEEVRDFLETHPGHSGGHKVLIAAYREKTQVLEEVIHLEMGDRT
jgi:hypothetical protein